MAMRTEVRAERGTTVILAICGDCGATCESEVKNGRRRRLDLALRRFGRAVSSWTFCACGER